MLININSFILSKINGRTTSRIEIYLSVLLPANTCGSYQILISDDEPEVHRITKMILKDFEFEQKSLVFLEAYTKEETIRILEENQDIAVLFQDVVMEGNSTGLEIIIM